MLKKWSVILGLAAIAALALGVYLTYRVPLGVEPMGDRTETIAWISLSTSIVTMLTALVGLVQKFLGHGNNS